MTRRGTAPKRATPSQLHYAAEPGEEGSVATLLDVVRGLLVQEFEGGNRPDDIVMAPDLYEAVITSKAREVARGGEVTLLGLRVCCAADASGGHTTGAPA